MRKLDGCISDGTLYAELFDGEKTGMYITGKETTNYIHRVRKSKDKKKS